MTRLFQRLLQGHFTAGHSACGLKREGQATLGALAADALEVAKFTVGDLNAALLVDGFSREHGDFDGCSAVGVARLSGTRSMFVVDLNVIAHRQHPVDQPIAMNG